MSGLIVITRPVEDARVFAEEVEAAGFESFVEPMLDIQLELFEAPDLLAYGGLIFTSANGVRVFASRVSERDMPVYVVGEQTAAAARALGFTDVLSAKGAGEDLAALMLRAVEDKSLPFLHVRGRDVAQDLGAALEPEGFAVEALVVYEARAAQAFSEGFLERLNAGAPMAVTLFSKRTAETFMQLIEESGKRAKLRSIKALCISEAVLECVQNYQWAGTYASKAPDRAGMMALLETVSDKRKILMSDKSNADAIGNAEAIIERFGGIRPMAKKIDVAVTTIQGWKKRNTIPAARRNQVIEAAGQHGVDLSDIIEGAPAASADVQADKGPPANENAQDEGASVAEDVIELKTEAKAPPSIKASGSVPRMERGASSPEKPAPDLAAQLDEMEKKAVTKSTWINVVLILITVAAVLALVWPESKGNQGRLAGLEQNVDGLRGDVDAVKDEQSFLTTLIPEDLDDRIAALQDKAQAVKDKAQNVKETAGATVEKAQEISEDVLAEGAGTIEQRMVKLQGHMAGMSVDPRFEDLMARIGAMNNSLLGQQKLDGTMSQLSGVLGGFGGGETAQFNDVLEAARQENPDIGMTFNGVPKEDLKAAALLLGMSQFRNSLNRDNQPFQDDLNVLMKLVGEDNPDLNEALNRLAPRAEEGVLTPGGLSNEFKTIAGDVVVSSLKGEDVSFKDKASARMNELFQIEKDGELITGTPTQATLSSANTFLQNGDIAGAIAQMQTLDGDQAAIAQSWIDEAQATLMAQQLKKFMNGAGSGDLLGGLGLNGGSELIQNKETGINILRPAAGPVPSVLDKNNPFQ